MNQDLDSRAVVTYGPTSFFGVSTGAIDLLLRLRITFLLGLVPVLVLD
jgi:hypothetical protein